jgi:hypothetical protein
MQRTILEIDPRQVEKTSVPELMKLLASPEKGLSGITEEIANKIFSPLFTTKKRGRGEVIPDTHGNHYLRSAGRRDYLRVSSLR